MNIQQIWRLTKKTIKEGGLGVLVSTAIVKFLSFFPSIFIARILTKEDMAMLSYCDNIMSYIIAFAGLDMTTSLLRYCKGGKKDAEYYRFAMKMGIITNLIISLIVAIGVYIVGVKYEKAEIILFAMLLTACFQYIFDTNRMYIRTQLRFNFYNVLNIIYSCFSLVFIILLTKHFYLKGTIIARYISLLIVIVMSFIYIKKKSHQEKGINLKKEEKYGYIKFSIISLVTTAFSTLMPLNETFLVNNLITKSSEIADYKVAMALPYNLIFIASALLVYFAPIFAKHENDNKWIRKNSVLVGSLLLGIYFILTVVMFIGAPFFIDLLYGNKYANVIPLVNILTIVCGINAGIRMTPLNILYAIGKVKFSAINAAVTCVMQFVLDYYFIKLNGIHGVAVAGIFTYLLSGVSFWIYLFIVTKTDSEDSKIEWKNKKTNHKNTN